MLMTFLFNIKLNYPTEKYMFYNYRHLYKQLNLTISPY